MDALLDTSVIVDMLRGYSPAIAWIERQTGLFGVSRFVVLEILEGVQSREHQQRAIRFLGQFIIQEPASEDFNWATQAMVNHRLNFQIDVLDCLIAAGHHRLNIPLLTRNLKHFRPLIGALAQSPHYP
ncbi:MAG: PIN domain-containing protein [Anaerolineae bacterium]|jgi:predicted nucleic acid-binding protein|nr:PIN domain-containing protein [Anaerolineae bacterium]